MDDFFNGSVKRFGKGLSVSQDLPDNKFLTQIMNRGSCRKFNDQPVSDEPLNALCAVALASPSKSDLQQRDIILIEEQELRDTIRPLLGASGWAAEAPAFLVFCGNNRRQRQLHALHGIPFSNDHFDPLFNAIGDAAIALATFVTAAESQGLGTCPISQIRNSPDQVNDLLNLPDYVFPFAALAVGWPVGDDNEISPRLSLRATVHCSRFDDSSTQPGIEEYDERRREMMPYKKQRHTDLFGKSGTYCWSEEKARHYSQSERADFGSYLKKKGFKLL